MPRSLLSILVATLCFAMFATAGDTAAGRANSVPPARSVVKPAAEKSGVEKNIPKEKEAGAEKTAAPARPEGASLEAEIQQLKELLLEQKQELEAQRALLREQQQKIVEMEQRLVQQASASSSAAQEQEQKEDLKIVEGQLEAVADNTKELVQKVGKLEKDVSDQKKSADSKFRALGNFTFSGDLRLRGETFHGGTLSTPRNRERFRLRFNVNAKLTDEIFGGLTVASGDATDPISTNQTFTNFYQRKFFAIDKAFLSYKPKWFKPVGDLELTGGKFAYTWYHTELTWDNDLNPEGFSEVVSFKVPTPILERITLVGFQTYINESSGGPDSVMNGGQLQFYWKLGSRVRFSAYAGFYDFLRADAIRVAQSNISLTGAVNGGACATTPGCTVTVTIPNSAALSGSSNSNSTSATQFASKFGLLDLTGRFDIKTWSSRRPLMLQFNYANNTRACTNRTSGGLPVPPTNAPCNPRDRDAYWAEVQVGQTRERGDWNFGYTFIRAEREAVLAAFNFSDLRAPTNTVTSRVNIGYQAYRNITVSWTGLFGRQLVTGTASKEDILRRMQFDLFYKF